MLINFIFILSAFFNTIYAQQATDLKPFSHDGKKWGYYDSNAWDLGESWQVVIQPKFDEAGYFMDGIALVKENNESYYIDINGNYAGSVQPSCIMKKEEYDHPVGDLNLKEQAYIPQEIPDGLVFVRIKLNWYKK